MEPSTGEENEASRQPVSRSASERSTSCPRKVDDDADDVESIGSSWSHDEKKRAAHSDEVQLHLRQWMQTHLQYPYPSRSEKEKLAKETGLQFIQVAYWFTNARRRLLPGMIKEENIRRSKMGLQLIKRDNNIWARPLIVKPTADGGPHDSPFLSIQSGENGVVDVNGHGGEQPAMASPGALTAMGNHHMLWQSEPAQQCLRKSLVLPLSSPQKRQHPDTSSGPPRKLVKEEDEDGGATRRPVRSLNSSHHVDNQVNNNSRRSSCSSGDTSVNRNDSRKSGQGIPSCRSSEVSSNRSSLSMVNPAMFYAQSTSIAPHHLYANTVYTSPASIGENPAVTGPPPPPAAVPGADASAAAAAVQYLQYTPMAAPHTQAPTVMPSMVPGHTVLVHNHIPPPPTPPAGAAPAAAAFAGINGHHHHHQQHQQQHQHIMQSPTQMSLPLHNGITPGSNRLLPPHQAMPAMQTAATMPGPFGNVLVPSMPAQTMPPQAYINQPVYLALARGQ
eukprot:scpid88794/ scgid6021/ Homeobox protein unc-62; Uncoordinated protein 62